LYLKSLELQGFKSFPDKIKLDFNKGLTAVVGPNGSGKSNIGDAVRWVLGEQSSKTLRGAKMEDVIFAGTQMRKPVGFAQVTLNIDNSSGLLQIPSDEVSVTRKLYRSGDSEYLINGSQVRLKDIYELFMDTGLGRDGYSIIGQGRVAEIVSAKSNERREIFEEAAGISKLRYKKAEAERRLSAAQDNILRLNDIISELEGRVEPLRIQSEKAAKFLELAEKKKALEISVWISRLDELRDSLKEIDEKILINNTEYENIDNDITALEEEIQKSYNAMQSTRVRVEELQEKIVETERQSGQVNSDIAVYENDIAHSIETINNTISQQQGAAVSSIELRDRIASQNDRIAELEKEERESEELLSKLQSELENLNAEADKFDAEYEESGQSINKLYIRQSECNFTITSSETAETETAEHIKQSEEQLISVEQTVKSLKAEYDETAKGKAKTQELIDELGNKISGYTRLFESKNKKLTESKENLQQLIMKKNEYENKVNILNDLEKNMEGFAYSVKEVVRAGKNSRISGIHGTVAQLIKVDGKYSAAIETALGGALQNVVVENEETAKRCIRMLKEQNAGRATFLPITSVKGNTLRENGLDAQNGYVALASELVQYDEKYAGVVASLLGRIAVAEDIDLATNIAKKYGYKFRIVTLDGQVINAGGSFTGGSLAKSAGVLTRKNEIDGLNAELEKISNTVLALNADTSKLQSEVDKLSFDIEGYRDRLSTIGEDKVRFESEEKRIESLLTQGAEQEKAINAEISASKEKLALIKKQREDAISQLAECEAEIKRQEDMLAGRQGEKDNLHARREELSAKISQQKLKEVELRKDKENTLSGIEHLKESAENLKKSVLDLEEQIALHNDLIEQKKALIEKCRAELDGFVTKIEEYKAQIRAEQTSNLEFEKKSVELRNELKNKNEVKEKFSTEKTRFEARRESVQKDYDGIISGMWEEYELTRSDAEKIAVPVENLMVAQKELNEYKNKIRNLGTVNLSAIEEYAEVSQRYKFLSEQLSDVEMSKKELEKLISELTEDMRRRFSESFEEINSNFKQIFVELFGGGKAELVLTNPDDVLESGIEINVAPPGKVIKNLSLLSGGEQAFVAIAIYFAILRIKPAPFCILDEIEAALDDVNVTKYAQYLRNFTNTTQFILVTHRRGTMEEADMLYGVTMQEKGISKLLKMSHDDVNSMAGDM